MIKKIKEISNKIILMVAGILGAIFILLKFLEGSEDNIEESIDEKEGENKQLEKNIKKNKEELKDINKEIKSQKQAVKKDITENKEELDEFFDNRGF
jgi:F0F1-type ATP synthase membrane subunit b/b'